MPGVFVHFDPAPHNGFLLAWGRAPDAWWGLVQFIQRVRTGAGDVQELPVAAWMPAASLHNAHQASTAELPRVALAVQRDAWPPPSRWPHWYVGPWPNGELRLPEGLEAFNGSTWRMNRGQR
ncbi:hypothetical protein [uncultured Jatrophihabitans sp.]|uniref:hypothetical protein n=1 Tax=uncultured Jatrophihabitans sp. TaxID=1610747 RepID=UPI0035CBBA68